MNTYHIIMESTDEPDVFEILEGFDDADHKGRLEWAWHYDADRRDRRREAYNRLSSRVRGDRCSYRIHAVQLVGA